MTLFTRLPATTGAALFLLSACGGGASTANPSPSPSIPAPTPSPSPSPANFPKDYQLSYLSPTQGIFTVSANTMSTSTRRTSVQSLLSVPLYDGEWNNGVVVNNRPYALAFLDGNSWKLLSLRTNTSQAVMDAGVTETREICYEAGAFSLLDFEAPDKSLLMYSVPGPDAECETADDIYAAFQLGSRTVVDLGRQLSFHQFRNSNGGLTGYLVQVGAELRLYTPGSGSFKVVASGLQLGGSGARNAAFNARTTSSVWLRWDNRTVKGIYRIDADGSLSAPLYSVPSADLLFGGFSDPDAMFVVHRAANSSSTEIVRIPFDGSVVSVIATTTDMNPTLAAISDTNLLLRTSDAATANNFLVVRKSGGTPIAVVRSDNDFLGSSPNAYSNSSNQFFLNTYTRSSDNFTSSALVVSAQGQVVERVDNSEWFAALAENPVLGRPSIARISKAARVESYAGPYATNGHRGGTIVLRDFSAGTRSLITQVTASGVLRTDFSSQPVDLAIFGSADNTRSDIFSFDLDNPTFMQLTNTPNENERIP